MKRIMLLLVVMLAGCSSSAEAGAPQAVEAYLDALVNDEGDRVVSLSCAEWEAGAQAELMAFAAVEARLSDDVACTVDNTEGGFTKVTCSGAIIATYDGEDQAFELEERTYLTTQVGGDWLVCGLEN